MALTLRELLEKQRLEREQREQSSRSEPPPVSVQPARPAAVEEKPVTLSQPPPQPAPPEENSLLARLRKSGSANGTEATANVSPSPTFATASPANVSQAQQVAPETKPAPAYTEDETENLRRNLAFLAANMDEEKVIGQVLRSTVKQIQEHPELNAIMIDSDFDLIVAAARRSMKFAVRKKEDRAEGRGKKKAQADELAAFLKDQGIEL